MQIQQRAQAKLRGMLVVGAALTTILAPSHGARAGGGDAHGGFFDSVLETMDLKTKEGPKPDFVEATHPDPSTLRFIPTGEQHPKRPVAAKSSDAVEDAKAALDAARDAQLAPKAPPVVKPAPPAKSTRKAVKPNKATADN